MGDKLPAPTGNTSESDGDQTAVAAYARRRWRAPIDSGFANVPLLACCFVTGLLDTTMFKGERQYHL